MTEIKGRHVLTGFVLAFGVIISVNLTLAFNAIHTFPGLEVKNSYVASQGFEKRRAEQRALDWTATALIKDGFLYLAFDANGSPVLPSIEKATFGSATHVGDDQELTFDQKDDQFVAYVGEDDGNWNLRLKARSRNGTLFEQRVIVGGGQ